MAELEQDVFGPRRPDVVVFVHNIATRVHIFSISIPYSCNRFTQMSLDVRVFSRCWSEFEQQAFPLYMHSLTNMLWTPTKDLVRL